MNQAFRDALELFDLLRPKFGGCYACPPAEAELVAH